MKIGDLVHDYSLGMNGVIIGWLTIGGLQPTFWEILYEDGEIDGACENEIEVINNE